jgi:hypothetical protein
MVVHAYNSNTWEAMQEDCKFPASLGYIAKQTNKQQTTKQNKTKPNKIIHLFLGKNVILTKGMNAFFFFWMKSHFLAQVQEILPP